MRELDRRAIEEEGIPGIQLMEAAGHAVYQRCLAFGVDGAVVVLCGLGNNGGDGFVIARLLAERGVSVDCLLLGDPARLRGDALTSYQRLCNEVTAPLVVADQHALLAQRDKIIAASVVVDALFGTGLARPVDGHYATAIAFANQSRGKRIAVDVPSGIDADNGRLLGVAIDADLTVSFAFAKLGLVSDPGARFVGHLEVVDIGIPESIVGEADFSGRVLDAQWVADELPRRTAFAHKGTVGHVLAVAGSIGKSGAAQLCGRAALRGGAGLCTVAMPAQAMSSVVAGCPELMTAALGDDGASAYDQRTLAALAPLIARADVVAVGPGIPGGPANQQFIEELIATAAVPLVIDADGLNSIDRPQAMFQRAGGEMVLTPHPKEMARLLGIATSQVQADRITVARQFAADHGVVVVLKGWRTVIAGPTGQLAINPTGNSGMATAGAGDVLTGLIAALIAQGMPVWLAACAAVYLHGAAGDLAARELGERSLIAGDIVERLGAAFLRLPEALLP
ncbi:MAG: NAD(P)H-hydrate dehydratase [Deltaproteobacteria bacterium]|nr:NAD(P)H-hydrate dehydratase [Deltaproteobacteria bacterium]